MSQRPPHDDQNDSQKPVYDAEIVGQDNGSNYNHSRRYNSQTIYGQPVFAYSASHQGGCAAAAITFGLFIICLGQYGLLAAIGFFVFHLIGALMGTISAGRALMAGRPFNSWTWRIGNWLVSMLLTVWLAGGLEQ